MKDDRKCLAKAPPLERFGRKGLICLLLLGVSIFDMACVCAAWAATRVASSPAMVDVQAAINTAVDGDVVEIPAGIATWGASNTYLSISKAITLRGAGKGITVITLSDTGGKYGNGTMRISAAATVRSMTINGSNAAPVTAFSISSKDGWRITDIDYNGGTTDGYFVIVSNVYGLIDSNDITGANGSAELIFTRGRTDSWQTPHSIGGADNVFIEDNIFSGRGYVCDINANGRAVIRYNTISGAMKIDGHGKASNTPARGVRHMEVYGNRWTNTSNYWAAIELRGGGGRIFDNVIESTSSVWVILTEYSATGTWPNFGNVCQCPGNYPIDDQIGVGMDPKAGGSEPLYLWNNTKNGAPWTITWPATTSCNATCGTFTMPDIIKEGRDFFMSVAKPEAIASYVPYGVYRNGRYYHPLRESIGAPKNLQAQ